MKKLKDFLFNFFRDSKTPEKEKTMKGVSFNKQNNSWRVQWSQYGVKDNKIKRFIRDKHFPIKKYGNKKAYKLACDYRKWIENNILNTNQQKELKEKHKKEKKNINKENIQDKNLVEKPNKIKEISYEENRGYRYWVAFWTDYIITENGIKKKNLRKKFSIKKYGNDKAYNLAYNYRMWIENDYYNSYDYNQRKLLYQQKKSPVFENQNITGKNGSRKGVSFNSKSNSWIASWIQYKKINGKIFKKYRNFSFAINKYGNEKAYTMATQKRRWAEQTILSSKEHLENKKIYNEQKRKLNNPTLDK